MNKIGLEFKYHYAAASARSLYYHLYSYIGT